MHAASSNRSCASLNMLGMVTNNLTEEDLAIWLEALAGDFMVTASRLRLQACYHVWGW